jgi:hypothetical protein
VGIYLASTSDKLSVKTDTTANVDVHAWWSDLASGSQSFGRLNTAISSAVTSDVVGSPGSGVTRSIKWISIRNRHATKVASVTVIHTDGTNAPEMIRANLSPGHSMIFDEDDGWTVFNSCCGSELVSVDYMYGAQVAGETRFTVLDADVSNACATADKMLSIPGLEFPVEAGIHTYYFRAVIFYTAAATATGARFSIFGDAVWTTLMYKWESSLTTTTKTNGEGFIGYDSPSAASGSSAATGSNVAIVEGFVVSSFLDATIKARVASEVAGSAIGAKAGSHIMWQKMS